MPNRFFVKHWLLAALVCLGGEASAQPSVRLRGVVLDSTRMRPLDSARVYAIPVATGGRLQAVTDTAGRYTFAALPLGTYLIDVRHARRDSLGVDVPLVTLEVREAGELDLTLGLPSLKTVITDRCGPEVEREGGGVISGNVRSVRAEGLTASATVVARWRTIVVDKGKMARDSGSAVARADDSGRYLFCGLPPGAGVAIQGVSERDSSGVIDLVMTTDRFLMRDVVVAPRLWRNVVLKNGAGDTAEVKALTGPAQLRGEVRDDAGRPISGAQVTVSEAEQRAMTSSTGAFAVDSLPAGTQVIDVRAIGFLPMREPVELTVQDTPHSVFTMTRVATSLDAVKVTAERVYSSSALARFERRRKGLPGYFLGVKEIEEQLAIFPSDLVFRAPGVYVRGSGPDQYIAMRNQRGEMCLATIVVDGARIESTDGMLLQMLAPLDRLVGVEVYSRPTMVPPELPNAQGGCGLVAFWTGSRTRGAAR